MHDSIDVSELRKRTLIFAALIAWCGALLFVRVMRSHSGAYLFLVWNLILAIVPAAAAIWFAQARSRVTQSVGFVIWLLFLPNAPYILTDFVHLRERPGIPLWFDIALLLSFAGTGLLLGYSSLADVQGVVAKRFGHVASWATAFTALILSGFGIYLGRFLRFNSWDVLSDPLTMTS